MLRKMLAKLSFFLVFKIMRSLSPSVFVKTPSPRPQVLCIDLDGVVADISGGDWENAKVIPGAKEALTKLKGEGWYIWFWTARPDFAKDATLRWLERNRIPYDGIEFEKPVAALFIDDHALEFRDWSETMRRIRGHG